MLSKNTELEFTLIQILFKLMKIIQIMHYRNSIFIRILEEVWTLALKTDGFLINITVQIQDRMFILQEINRTVKLLLQQKSYVYLLMKDTWLI